MSSADSTDDRLSALEKYYSVQGEGGDLQDSPFTEPSFSATEYIGDVFRARPSMSHVVEHCNELLHLERQNDLETRELFNRHYAEYVAMTTTTSTLHSRFSRLRSSFSDFATTFGQLDDTSREVRSRLCTHHDTLNSLRTRLSSVRLKLFLGTIGQRIREALQEKRWERVCDLVKIAMECEGVGLLKGSGSIGREGARKALQGVQRGCWEAFEKTETSTDVDRLVTVLRRVTEDALSVQSGDDPMMSESWRTWDVFERILRRLLWVQPSLEFGTTLNFDDTTVQLRHLRVHFPSLLRSHVHMILPLLHSFKTQLLSLYFASFESAISSPETSPSLIRSLLDGFVLTFHQLSDVMTEWKYSVSFIDSDFRDLVSRVSDLILEKFVHTSKQSIRSGWKDLLIFSETNQPTLRDRADSLVDCVLEGIKLLESSCCLLETDLLFRGTQPFGSKRLEALELAKHDVVRWALSEWIALCGGGVGIGILPSRLILDDAHADRRSTVDFQGVGDYPEAVLLMAFSCEPAMLPSKLESVGVDPSQFNWKETESVAYTCFGALKGQSLMPMLLESFGFEREEEGESHEEDLTQKLTREVERIESFLHEACPPELRLQLVGGGSSLSLATDPTGGHFDDFSVCLHSSEVGSSFAVLRVTLKMALRSLLEYIRLKVVTLSLDEFEEFHRTAVRLQRSWRSLIPNSTVMVGMFDDVILAALSRCSDLEGGNAIVREGRSRRSVFQ